jgi:hypothetical protein
MQASSRGQLRCYCVHLRCERFTCTAAVMHLRQLRGHASMLLVSRFRVEAHWAGCVMMSCSLTGVSARAMVSFLANLVKLR